MDKRHMFFLQLFADDDGAEGAEGSASGGDPDPAGKEGQEGGTEKKPDDNGEKKYSDADVDKIVSADCNIMCTWAPKRNVTIPPG